MAHGPPLALICDLTTAHGVAPLRACPQPPTTFLADAPLTLPTGVPRVSAAAYGMQCLANGTLPSWATPSCGSGGTANLTSYGPEGLWCLGTDPLSLALPCPSPGGVWSMTYHNGVNYNSVGAMVCATPVANDTTCQPLADGVNPAPSGQSVQAACSPGQYVVLTEGYAELCVADLRFVPNGTLPGALRWGGGLWGMLRACVGGWGVGVGVCDGRAGRDLGASGGRTCWTLIWDVCTAH